VIYKGINFYPRQIETALLKHPGVSHEYQVVLDSDGGGERMTIHVETEPGCDPAVAARIRELYAQGDKGSRLQAIKELRAATGLGLADAVRIADKLGTPKRS